jgi:hypothetical protein
MAVHAPTPVTDLPDAYERLYERKRRTSRLRLAVEYARFGWRRMSTDAAPVLNRLIDAGHECWIVTGRSEQGIALLHRWLRRSGLDERVAGVRMAPPGLRPPQHKLAIAKILGIDSHIDDDPRTAYHLAKNGVPHVYLLDRADAQDDTPLPAGLTVVRSLPEFADRILAL